MHAIATYVREDETHRLIHFSHFCCCVFGKATKKETSLQNLWVQSIAPGAPSTQLVRSSFKSNIWQYSNILLVECVILNPAIFCAWNIFSMHPANPQGLRCYVRSGRRKKRNYCLLWSTNLTKITHEWLLSHINSSFLWATDTHESHPADDVVCCIKSISKIVVFRQLKSSVSHNMSVYLSNHLCSVQRPGVWLSRRLMGWVYSCGQSQSL